MRITPLLGAVLAFALLTSQASAVSATQQSVLSGRTAQGKRISLAFSPGNLQMLSFRARLRCDNGDLLIVAESGFLPTPLRRGRFDDLQIGSTDEVRFRGRLTGATVRGRLLVKDRLRVREGKRERLLSCASGWIGFSAQA